MSDKAKDVQESTAVALPANDCSKGDGGNSGVVIAPGEHWDYGTGGDWDKQGHIIFGNIEISYNRTDIEIDCSNGEYEFLDKQSTIKLRDFLDYAIKIMRDKKVKAQ